MEESGGSLRFSLFWRRDELRRLRRLRRRVCSDPLLAKQMLQDGSVLAGRAVMLKEPAAEKRPVRRAETHRRGEERTGDPRWRGREGMFPHRSFWKITVGIAIVVAVTLFILGTAFNPPKLAHLEPCPDDWLYYKKKCYYHSGAMADWNSSKEFCSFYGASLAMIDNHQELNFIMYRIRITDFWIGLHRKENKFFWVNGEPFDTSLFHINITSDGDCVHIDSTFISTRSCSSFRNWLCTISQYKPKTHFL